MFPHLSLQIMNGSDETLCCNVCLEPFETTGKRLPKLLPCTHTSCAECVTKLTVTFRSVEVANMSVDMREVSCPECQKKHYLTVDESFPQNKYIVAHLQDQGRKVDHCGLHSSEMNLFCNEPDCQEPICPVGVALNHRRHDVVDLRSQIQSRRGGLVADLKTFEEDVLKVRNDLVEARNGDLARECIAEIEAKKKEVVALFDQLIAKAARKAKAQQTELQDVDPLIYRFDDVLQRITEKQSQAENATSYKEIAKLVEELRSDAQEVQKDLAGRKLSEVWHVGKDVSRDAVCGHVAERKEELGDRVRLAKTTRKRRLSGDDSLPKKKRVSTRRRAAAGSKAQFRVTTAVLKAYDYDVSSDEL